MDAVETLLNRGVQEILVKESLIKRLNSGKKLVVKLGIDPTGSELHLGHAVVLRKLSQFQDLGHQAVLVIGDFTAKIGDPSGRIEERKNLTDEQIKENMKSYKEQASKILDIKKARFEFNSSWLAKLGMEGIFELASKATLAQIQEREEFRNRLAHKIDIPYLEMLYPLMQGYDSVALKADVELGGTDQKFNLLMGRQIQKRYNQKEQDIVMMELLPGTDGAKMSKSAQNYISLTADPYDMYGKVMSISDEVMPLYYKLCTDLEPSGQNFDDKKRLAKEIVRIYHGKKLAAEAEENFEKVYQKGQYQESQLIHKTIPAGKYKPVDIPINSGATTSTSQAKDLMRSGAVQINGKVQKIESWSEPIEVRAGDIIKVGDKRIVKVE
jgi:tyrosyl-tRNA synthetase